MIRRLLLLTLLALSCALVTGPPAQAAECTPNPLRFGQYLDRATVVLTGTITEIGRDESDRPTYTVQVGRIYRGEPGAEVVLHASREAACALPAAAGEEWLIVATGAEEPWTVRKDSGSRPLTDEVGRALSRQLGSGTPPAAEESTGEVAFTDADPGRATTFWPLALPGVAILGFGILVLLVSRTLAGGKDRP